MIRGNRVDTCDTRFIFRMNDADLLVKTKRRHADYLISQNPPLNLGLHRFQKV